MRGNVGIVSRNRPGSVRHPAPAARTAIEPSDSGLQCGAFYAAGVIVQPARGLNRLFGHAPLSLKPACLLLFVFCLILRFSRNNHSRCCFAVTFPFSVLFRKQPRLRSFRYLRLSGRIQWNMTDASIFVSTLETLFHFAGSKRPRDTRSRFVP